VPIIRAYARDGRPEAAKRIHGIINLFQAAGRGGEAAWVSWDSNVYDPHFKMVFSMVVQNKVNLHLPSLTSILDISLARCRLPLPNPNLNPDPSP